MTARRVWSARSDGSAAEREQVVVMESKGPARVIAMLLSNRLGESGGAGA